MKNLPTMPCMQRTYVAVMLLAWGSALMSSKTFAQSVWSGNGHTYEAVYAPGLTWVQAQAACAARGGYLATITSEHENDFVKSLFENNPAFWFVDGFNNALGPWTGGIQASGSSEPGGGWGWANGEPFAYTDWSSHDPDNCCGLNQNRIQFIRDGNVPPTQWTDVEHFAGFVRGYIFEFSEPECVAPPTSLESWWRGENDANDFAGDNHGTLINGATFSPGKVGQAFSFDGVDDYVSVPDNADWDFGMNDFTIDLWIRFDQLKHSMFIHQQSGSNFGGFEFDFQPPSGMLVFSRNGNDGGIARAWSPQTSTWYHLAVTRTDGTYKLYVNGAQQGNEEADPLPVADVTGIVRIGSWAGSNLYYVDGLIDEVDVFHRALSATEIQSIYSAGSGGKCQECTPPTVSVAGTDPVFTSTTHTFAATTDANNPSFEWSVAGGTINGSNTNNSVSITAGAVGTMTLSVNVTDGLTNCSTEETKEVTVNPPPAGIAEVVFATNSIWLKEHAKILSGNVIVNNMSSGPVLDSQVELSVGQGVTTPAGFALKGNRIKVKQGAVVVSDIYYHELTNNGTLSGSQNSSLTLPVFASLPPFHQAPAGTQDLTVLSDQSITLSAGVYREILIKQNGTILFTGGGTFAFRSLNAGMKAKLLFDAPTEILIEGKLDTDENSYVGPQSGVEIGAADIVFYVAGINGNNGNFGATPKAAQLGLNNTVLANFYVPNGTLWLRQGTVATGAFLGRDVIVGEQVQVALESAFGEGSSLAKSGNDESGRKRLVSTMIPEAFVLLQNYPNPFNPETEIRFLLPVAARVVLRIFGTDGRAVRTLAEGNYTAGDHTVRWDAKDNSGNPVASGTYLYQLQAGGNTKVKKMSLLR